MAVLELRNWKKCVSALVVPTFTVEVSNSMKALVVLLVSDELLRISKKLRSLVRVLVALALRSGPDIVTLVDPEGGGSTSNMASVKVSTVEPVICTRASVEVVVKEVPSISSSPPPLLLMVLLFLAIKPTPLKVPPEISSTSINISSSLLVVPVIFRVLLSIRNKGSLAAKVRLKSSTSEDEVGSSSMTLKVTVVSFRSSNVPVKLNVFPLSSMSTSESAVTDPSRAPRLLVLFPELPVVSLAMSWLSRP